MSNRNAGRLFNKQLIVFGVVMLAAGSAVAALSFRAPSKRVKFAVDASAHTRVAADELARWIIEGRRDFAVVDLRSNEAYEAGHVKDAVHCGSCHESRQEGRRAVDDHFVDLSKKLVLYTQTGKEAIELPRLLAKNPRLLLLDGGYDAWKASVLAPVTFGGEVNAEEREGKLRREAARGFFAGERAGTGAAPAQLPVTPIRRENAHQPAGAREGC